MRSYVRSGGTDQRAEALSNSLAAKDRTRPKEGKEAMLTHALTRALSISGKRSGFQHQTAMFGGDFV